LGPRSRRKQSPIGIWDMETRVQTEPNGGDDRRRGKRRRRMRRSEIHELMRWPQNSEGQELLMLKLKHLC
jgi:hypothetical protein